MSDCLFAGGVVLCMILLDCNYTYYSGWNRVFYEKR